jgi:membrane protein implicated in regulation of membrane protease activity
MLEYFNQLSGFEKTLFIIAIPSTIIMLIQFILTIVGMDSTGDMDMDLDMEFDADSDADDLNGHSPFELLTFRNIVTFFSIMGWSGLALNQSGYSQNTVLIFSFLLGIASMFVMSLLVYGLYKLKQENSHTINSAVGKKGIVYLEIPSKGNGKGKITITLNGYKQNLNAYSNGPELKYGSIVEVVEVDGNEVFVDEAKYIR